MSTQLKDIKISDAKRIVLKIGSALLVDDQTGQIRKSWLETLAQDVATCKKRGQEVVIVTSGAIALGRRILSFGSGSLKLNEKQAAAACGNIQLAHAYQDVLEQHGLSVAQILVTIEDTESRNKYLNARDTIDTLLKMGAVPMINENDTVATDEIRFGDNDRLAARVAAMISADALVLFSDIDGLYTADPTKNSDATFIPVVENITPEIEAMGTGSGSDVGSGGMVTKIKAAKIAMDAGCKMVITKGAFDNPLHRLENDGPCTWFLPASNPVMAHKRWIMGSLKVRGTFIVDDGAVRALEKGTSLLPIGVKSVEGTFTNGDAVEITDMNGKVIARGLSAYRSDEAVQIVGLKSSQIKETLGYIRRDEMIHRDYLVMS